MEMVTILMPILQSSLGWNRARINFLAQFLIALIKVKTVNFSEIAVAFSSKAKSESSYKRIQRFFHIFEIDFVAIARIISKMMPIMNTSWALTMDRTNWKLGRSNINILVLAIAYKGIAFPIFWVLLPKRGNSNTRERIDLMNCFIHVFSIAKIKCLLADREFLGERWFGYLLQNSIHFRIRIRENMFISNAHGALVKARDLFRYLAIGEYQILSNRLVDGHRLFVVCLKLRDGYLILVTDSAPEHALEDYARRWEIEVLFSCLKTRGFRFEETHLTKPERIQKLVAILAIAFAFIHTTGEWLNEQKRLSLKKHGRKARSIFRYGMDFLRNVILNFHGHLQDFSKIASLFAQALSFCASFHAYHSTVFE